MLMCICNRFFEKNSKKIKEGKEMRRTDIAIESLNITKNNIGEASGIPGVLIDYEEKDDYLVTKLSVRSREGAEKTGKPEGEYVTIDAPGVKYDNSCLEAVSHEIAKQIRRIGSLKKDNVILVVGLGNREITPDALGCDVVSKIIITNHIKKQSPEILSEGMRAVCAIAPGVLGTTGMESLEITKGVSEKLKPDIIIVIDALAAGEFSRVSTTFQISDAGIAPGSGVGNNRDSFSEESLGVKVIAIGVPTVVDAKSICDCEIEGEPMMVTPRDIDLVIKRCAKTVALGINLALHEGFSVKDIEELS